MVYFYDISKLYQHSYINGNVDEKLIKPTLAAVQDIYILPLIGTGIYDEITSQITSGTVSSKNQTLLNSYLQPTILWWVMYEFTFAGHFKYMNKGIMERNSENGQPVRIENLERIAKPHKDKAQNYQERTSRFLLQNSSTYNLYLNPGNHIDTIYPDFENFSTGMNLDDDHVADRSSMRFNGVKNNEYWRYYRSGDSH